MTGAGTAAAAPDLDPLGALLDHLKRTRAFDFTGYKRASLERRIRKRMAEVGVEGYLDYRDHLELHPQELSALFNTILINVTGFFRDPEAWEFVREDVVPRILVANPTEPIRAWCAGAATGEESYTAAMVLCEALGEDEFRRRVKIYGTDVDGEALDTARQAVFTAKQVEPVPPELRERYFERVEQRYAFRKDLRRSVIFGRNDLVQDAPISRVDLLTCRNTLMYFNAETQARIVRRFHFALKPAGFLLLGRSETLTHADLFAPVNVRRRVFAKVDTPTLRDRLALGSAPNPLAAPEDLVRVRAWDTSPIAQVVVDREGLLAQANDAARALLHLGAADLGRPLHELELSYRPVELRARIEEAVATGGEVVVADVPLAVRRGDDRRLEVRLAPLRGPGGDLGTTIAYVDHTSQHTMEVELERSRRELSVAYEEVQSTVEELETTNEELQSTNEELETTNEELQSTNEELETMNEELQSSNEELETMNDELRTRTYQLDHANAFMETILADRGIGLTVLDEDGVVRVWNRHAERQWGLREDEAVGRSLLGLDVGLPTHALADGLRLVLGGDESRLEVVVDATDRRARAVRTRVTVLRVDHDGAPGAVVLTQVDADGDGPAVARG